MRRPRSVCRFGLVAAAALVLAACASAPPAPRKSLEPIADAPFALDGRLSARRDRDGVAASFTWVHAPPLDTLSVATPLGQIVAELRGDATAHRVTMKRADGTSEEAADWATLTERALGFALPVNGLAAWARGAPHAGSPHTSEVDAAGRASLVRQDGWEIVYDYADDASPEPKRLRLTYPGLEVRIAVDRWSEP